MNIRTLATNLVEARWFQVVVATAICLNAAFVAIDSYGLVEKLFPGRNAGAAIEHAFLAVFVLELGLRLAANGLRFFRQPWSVFDALVTLPALVPAWQTLSIARVLRVIRLFRMISVFDSFRNLTTAMVKSAADSVSMAGIILIVLFVSGAIGNGLFGAASPELFGNIGVSMFTFFRAFAFFEALSIAQAIPSHTTLAMAVFMTFYSVMTFLLTNFFVAIAMFHMYVVLQERQDAKKSALEAEAPSETQLLRLEIAELKAMIAELRPEAASTVQVPR